MFKDATTFFSRATPNLTTVIPAIDHINEILTSHESDESLNGSVRAALSLGKKTLDRYHSLTDSSEVYQIAMGEFDFSLFIFTLYFHTKTNTSIPCSLAPTPQALIFPNRWMDCWLDPNRWETHPRRIRSPLCQNCCGRRARDWDCFHYYQGMWYACSIIFSQLIDSTSLRPRTSLTSSLPLLLQTVCRCEMNSNPIWVPRRSTQKMSLPGGMNCRT